MNSTDGRWMFLLHTPGFNATYHTDVEIFKELIFLLSRPYRNGRRPGGIVYLHRITDNRVAGFAVRSFNALRTMYDPNAAKIFQLVTTTWNSIPSGSGLEAISPRGEHF
ncbi:hypothetical protein F4808DRAFT_439674 [Astrocystis sublimbata]|nr:hypothetical protein F4808DRAFT_439674 [Astrocystis sublimbata]